MLNAVELAQYVESAKQFYGALEELETALGATRFLAGDFVTEADAALYVTLVRFDLLYSRYLVPVKYRVQDMTPLLLSVVTGRSSRLQNVQLP